MKSASRNSLHRAAALLSVLAASAALGQPAADPALPPEVQRAMVSIRAQTVVDHAKILSSAEYYGRDAGSKSIREAAQYIAARFRKAGLLPGAPAGSFYQTFKIRPGFVMNSRLQAWIGQESLGEFERGRDYMPLSIPGKKCEVRAECVLAGYGITVRGLDFDEYKDADVRGRCALVFSGTPWNRKTAAWIRRSAEAGKYETLQYKARNAAEHGAVCLLVVDNPAGWRKQVAAAERLRIPDMASPIQSAIPIIHVTRKFAAALSGMNEQELRLLAVEIGVDQVPQSTALRARRIHLVAEASGTPRMGRNIVGILPGRDDKLRKEAVVIGAHYDHLGEGAGGICFGANDNAAGVGALIAVADAFTNLPAPPRRTMIFVAFDAEEVGRLGSNHYVAHPPVLIRQTVLMINFDMIGRNEPNEIYAVGTRSSDGLHAIHRDANRHVGLTLVHPQSYRLGRSDHSPFYFADVPIMYLFGGFHLDYNTPQDTWDKLVPAKLEKVARLAFLTARAVAERRERIRFRSREEPDVPPEGRMLPEREP